MGHFPLIDPVLFTDRQTLWRILPWMDGIQNKAMSGFFAQLARGDWLEKERVLTYPVIILVLTIISTGFVLFTNAGLLPNGSPFGSDFISFWTAAREALAGRPHVPYEPALFEPAQRELFPLSSYYAFFYPPHYLAYMMPLGLLSYYGALFVWMLVSFAASAFVLVRITSKPMETVLLALAFPAAFLTISHGQNAFLSAALFAGGLYLLPKRPILAGILFGLLTFKPQLGILVPFALFVGGYWRAIFSAGATLAVLMACAAVLFGADIWSIFLAQSGLAVETMREGIVAWEKMISAYASLRLFGLSNIAASVVHYSIAVVVAIFVILVWLPRNHVSHEVKSAALLCGALIITPFGLNYDLFVLAPAIALISSIGLVEGFLSFEKTVLAVVYLSPIIVLLFMALGVSIAPIFLLLFFALLMRRAMHEMGTVEMKLQSQTV